MCVSTRYSLLMGAVFSQCKQEKNIFMVDNQKENNISKEESNMIIENGIQKISQINRK